MLALWYSTAAALAKTVTKEDLARKQLYPALPGIRDISAQVAAAVAEVAYEKGNLMHPSPCNSPLPSLCEESGFCFN